MKTHRIGIIMNGVTGRMGTNQHLIRSIKAVVAPLKFAPTDRDAVDVPALSRTLYSLQGYFGAASEEVKKENDKKLLAQLDSCSEAITL